MGYIVVGLVCAVVSWLVCLRYCSSVAKKDAELYQRDIEELRRRLDNDRGNMATVKQWLKEQ